MRFKTRRYPAQSRDYNTVGLNKLPTGWPAHRPSSDTGRIFWLAMAGVLRGHYGHGIYRRDRRHYLQELL